MFTGIIETTATLIDLKSNGTNIDFYFESTITNELKIDQSIAHNGVCLTVVEIKNTSYKVSAILETLNRSNFNKLKKGDVVNIERCMPANGRFDGHIVQGHVDCVAFCKKIIDINGSWEFEFELNSNEIYLVVEKGSVTINGVSLTVVRGQGKLFSVHIIPYTFEHTNFKYLAVNSVVNIEFDIIGKYVKKMLNKDIA
ncbi:MAG: riboflavin synthase [Bacteroidetes bacterium]|nr:riboflavin synthase [Bacteroidota bacterium]